MSGLTTEGFLDEVLENMVKKEASDLYITVGSPAIFRVNERFVNHSEKRLDDSDISDMMKQLLTPSQIEQLSKDLELNVSFEWQSKWRFRLNFFYQQRNIGIVFRLLKTKIPTIKELGLPQIYADLILRKKGLILISSPTGSGKSTSVAAMLDYRNTYGSGHIITIEDPIEYVHTHKKCLFTQREIAIDTISYHVALINGLRQKADVVFIGEIRDRDTMEHAIKFAETGHLCIATLHSNNANQSLIRMINLFPENSQKAALFSLSENIEAIISQKLVIGVNNKRILVPEVMLNVGLIKTLIAEARIEEIKDIMEKHEDIGMITFDTALFKMAKLGLITFDEALENAENRSQLSFRFKQSDVNSPLNKALSSPINKSIF